MWREVWKYGERGLRYSLLDAGHAAGALIYSAAMVGWSAAVLLGPSGNVGWHAFLLTFFFFILLLLLDSTSSTLCGLTRAKFEEEEEEVPAMLVLLQPEKAVYDAATSISIDEASVQAFSSGVFNFFPSVLSFLLSLLSNSLTADWRGVPSTLSWRRLNWPVVSAAQRASRRSLDAPASISAPSACTDVQWQQNAPTKPNLNAAEIVRTRRSATAFLPPSMSLCVALLLNTKRLFIIIFLKGTTLYHFCILHYALAMISGGAGLLITSICLVFM